jgi:parallel beta-helix repeat protein
MKPIVPQNGMTITQDCSLQPGQYFIPDGIRISGSNIVIQGNGASLFGDQHQKVGIHMQGVNEVSVQNLNIQRYHHGILANNCRAIKIIDCKISDTAEIPPNTIFLNIWISQDHPYGSGIILSNVSDSLIAYNDLQHQMNGLLTYGCSRLDVQYNIANYCSGWGFHLNNTCESIFYNNHADFCCRFQSRANNGGHMGADSAGFLIVNSSCRNTFRHNFARMSGDGFFIAGLTPDYSLVSCDDNIFEENDGSNSPNNAFEATFCSGNIFRKNLANDSNYGFWLGFSSNGMLEGNKIRGNRQAGIAAENGRHFKIIANTIANNIHGILLWSKSQPELLQAVPENNTSHDWIVEENIFEYNLKAVRIVANQDHGIRNLPISGEYGFHTIPPYRHQLQRNQYSKNFLNWEILGAEETSIEDIDEMVI